ncbi:tyrosine-type recombinase/integrase [Liquorilactobacillus mali]|uniref:tyrosine-type recombinase/integrase n=1 Tax=Liquorilactobacillus mali TaxID=1618 RepID=UPI0023500E27|nr:site-specific integrase [Liquorilactobacillus mali]MDC7953562.1 site-specific integrase [Liquorilactobacillus mali]
MWYEKLAEKKFKFIERYKDPYTDKYVRVSVLMNSNSTHAVKQAQQTLDRKISKKLHQHSQKVTEITIGELIKEWLALYKKRVRNSTYMSTYYSLKTFKNKINTDISVSKIDKKLVKKILEGLIYDDKLSNRYISALKSRLNMVFKYAVSQNYTKSNPISNLEIIYSSSGLASSTKNKFLDQNELKSLLHYTYEKNYMYGCLFEWLYLTGMRAGEALALNKNDIFKDKGTYFVDINGTLDYLGLRIEDHKKTSSTKTVSGMRTISLPKRAVEIYKQLCLITESSDFLFQTSNATPIEIRAINLFLRIASKKLKIDKHLSSHIFRHTHISKLAELGTPLYVIQERVGHKSSKITAQIYLHVTQKAQENLKKDLDKL